MPKDEKGQKVCPADTKTYYYYKDNVVWAQRWANTSMDYGKKIQKETVLWHLPEGGSMGFFSVGQYVIHVKKE